MKLRSALFFIALLLLFLAGTHVEAVRSVASTGRWTGLMVLAGMAIPGLLTSEKNLLATRRGQDFDLYILCWIAFAFLSAEWSIDSNLTLARAATLLIMYLAVFWSLWAFTDVMQEERMVRIVIAAALVVYALGIITVLYDWSSAFMGLRFRGVMENPNTVGGISAIVFPLCLRELLLRRSKLSYVVVGVVLGSLLLSGSRTGIAATAVSTAYVLWKTGFRGALKIILLLAVLSLSAFYFLGGYFFREAVLRSETLGGWANRFYIWELMWEYIQERPYWGHGFGTEDILHDYYGNQPRALGFRGNYATNSFIGLTAQVGFLGCVTFFAPLIGLFLKANHLARGDDLMTIALNAVLLSVLLIALTESWIPSMGSVYALPFWSAVMLLVRRLYHRKHQLQPNRPLSYAH